MTARLWMVDETEDGAATKSTSSPAGLLMSCVAECVGHAQTVSAVALSRRTNAFVVTASEDTTVKLWQLAPLENATSFPVKLRARFTIRAHEKDISSLAVAPNDKLFATGSQDRTIKVRSAGARWRMNAMHDPSSRTLPLIALASIGRQRVGCVARTSEGRVVGAVLADGPGAGVGLG